MPRGTDLTRTWNQAGEVEVLAFDIFGTVVDWHGSIAREIRRLHPQVDADAFALAWRAGYRPAMARVMSGELGWTLIDDLHRMILDDILPQFGLSSLDEAARRDLNRVWHRLDAWPDAVEGLRRLRQKYIVCTLSNGNLGLLTRMAKRAGLPWDCVLSAEVFRAYKPDPATYLGVAGVFDVPPARVMLVAAHHDDLAGARACGLRTAYVERPLEFGPAQPKDVSARAENDLHGRDLLEIAALLGC
jgi:2-haloacid dehalogenase